ncbi:CBN-TAX-4 protein [Aphelenchoides avenae]|nr:CBN-TAX-4 protein [Aphelenchus avenae]
MSSADKLEVRATPEATAAKAKDSPVPGTSAEEPQLVLDDPPAVKANHATTNGGVRNGTIVHNEDIETSIPEPPRATMGILAKSIQRFRRNRVGDTNNVSAEQNNFFQKFGIGPSTADTNEYDEFSKGRLKYIWNKLVVDANASYFYYWIAIVSCAYVYNLLVVIARTVFNDLAAGYLWMFWLVWDISMDFIFLTDMFFRSRTGFLEQGLMVRDVKRIRSSYLKSAQFKIDLLSILPLDYAVSLLTLKPWPVFRLNRLFRRERITKFMELTETRSSFPNAFRVGSVVWYIAVIIHWNACFYFMISESIGLGTDTWVYGKLNKQSLPEGIHDTLTRRYIYSFYWSTLILTTIGEVPGPQQDGEFVFVTMDLMCGVLIFATIVGNVGSMISNMSAARTEFQNRMDGIKQYMELRRVGKQLEVRVIKWFDYLWANKQSLSDQQVLKVLPDKLQAEIAMHVHFETLRKVRIFQDCEAGLLAELVLKLQLQVFSPMDYVCRKGDIGREMYIVKRGMLQVVADDGLKVFATLSEGAVFGELSILNIAGP